MAATDDVVSAGSEAPTSKRCTRCGEAKPLDDFARKLGSTPRASTCRTCTAEKAREASARRAAERRPVSDPVLAGRPLHELTDQERAALIAAATTWRRPAEPEPWCCTPGPAGGHDPACAARRLLHANGQLSLFGGPA